MELISGNQHRKLSKEDLRSSVISTRQPDESCSLTKSSKNDTATQRLLARAPNPTDFLTLVNPDTQIQVMKKYKYLGSLVEDGTIPTLKQVAAAYGENTAIEWLNIQIEHFLNTSEQDKVVNDASILEFAHLVLISYPYLSIYEFCFFIAKCRIGEYGPLYGRSGPNQLAAMLQTFLEKRRSVIEDIRRSKERQKRNAEPVCKNGLQIYLENLRKKAEEGDAEAARLLKWHMDLNAKNAALPDKPQAGNPANNK